jgi:hypothetical protein
MNQKAPRLRPINLQSDCPAWGNLTRPRVGEFEVANGDKFGVKVSVTTTHKEGLVIGMRSMPGNPYDGHTLYEALEQAAILTGCQPKEAFGLCGPGLPWRRSAKRNRALSP